MDKPKVYCAMFMGQGGYLLSMGVVQMSNRAIALGIESHVFTYSDFNSAMDTIDVKRKDGYLIAGLGYSLGVSALTWLQTVRPFDLVLCLAGSKLGQNYHINRETTKRSVLWRGPDILSSWGGLQGFDKVIDVAALHLWFDFDVTVVAGVQEELQKLIA